MGEAMNGLPPSPSPLRPASQLVRRKYSDWQLAEAKKLALSDGITYASEQTLVAKSTIYKLVNPPKPITRKARSSKPKAESPEKAMLCSAVWPKLKALAMFYHANVPNDSLRNAYGRAASKLNQDIKTVWRAHKQERYSQ